MNVVCMQEGHKFCRARGQNFMTELYLPKFINQQLNPPNVTLFVDRALNEGIKVKKCQKSGVLIQ